MNTWKQYVLSIIACTLCCGIVSCLVSGSRRKNLMQLISGTVLAVTVLYPVSKLDLHDLPDFLSDYRYSAQDFVRIGEARAQTERERYIKDACAAYISNKADVLGAVVTAEVYLDKELLPVYAEIQGHSGREAEAELARILESDLSITKENQVWIWNQEDNSS